MLKLTRLILPHTVSGIVGARRSSYDRVFDRLDQLDFITREINNEENCHSIKLQVLFDEPLYKLFAGEANKFLLASMISLDRARQQQNNNVAWQVIEHYYAAYFSIHYLARIIGLSISNLDSASISYIKRSNYCSGIESDVSIQKGLYFIKYNPEDSILSLEKPFKKSGGSHVDAWRLWVDILDMLILESEKDIEEYASESLILGQHKRFVLRSTDKFNPPILRGEINYQFSGGVWDFEKKSADSIRAIQKTMLEPLDMSFSHKYKSESFVQNNKFIISLACAVFRYSSENYPKSICRSIENKYSGYFNF